MQPGNKRVLGVFTLTMINVCAIQSLRNLPLMAEIGLASVFFYIIAGCFFFVPCALVSAELATGWPSTGGVYTWVKEAYDDRMGFVAIWLQWIENVIWYPTVLSFTAATIAYLFDPELANNKLYILAMILSVYWICTIIDSLGMKISGFFSSVGVIIGTIMPAIVIIILGIIWILNDNPLQIQFNFRDIFPDISNIQNIVFLVGVKLALSGMEMSAVHAKEVRNPQRDYPRAIFLSALIILATSIFGSLAISIVVPKNEISLVAGIMQAFSAFFAAYNVSWMTPIAAALIAFGAIATVSTWIVGPSKGLFQTSHEGHLPPFFHKRNRFGMPIMIMLTQGLIVSFLSFAFLFMPSVSSTYWLLVDLTAILYLIMYVVMFMSAIKLRYLKPKVKRAYRVPGGKTWGMNIVAGVGIISSLFAIVVGFIPPANLDPAFYFRFELSLIIGVLVMVLLPLIIYANQKDHWKIEVLKEDDD